MSQVKKLLCNPPAEAVASSGDAKLAGMFRGAGAAIHHLAEVGTHPAARTEFTHAVLAIEQEYMDAREELEEKARTRLQVQFDWLVAKVDSGPEPSEDGRRGGGGGNGRDEGGNPRPAREGRR